MMSAEIINRVASADLITIDLSDYTPNENIHVFDIKEFLSQDLILKEESFRSSLKKFDFSVYSNKIVTIQCSAYAIVPMWAYMLASSYLTPISKDLLFGSKEVAFHNYTLNNIEKINGASFNNKKVIIKGCVDLKLVEPLYIAITNKLQPHVQSLMFGEACSAVPIYKSSNA